MKKPLVSLLMGAMIVCSCANGDHFITDKQYRETMQKTLSERLDGEEGDLKQFFKVNYAEKTIQCNNGYVNDGKITQAETEALEFLYAYMPVADVTDYPTDYYLQNVRASFEAKEQMPWGKDIPEMIFRHFVLPVRVNNENLDTSRVEF